MDSPPEDEAGSGKTHVSKGNSLQKSGRSTIFNDMTIFNDIYMSFQGLSFLSNFICEADHQAGPGGEVPGRFPASDRSRG